MDVVRRNTDYAIRLVMNLAKHYEDKPISTKAAASEEDVPYQLACKLMQKLHNAGLVKSSMGPKGGFGLSAKPAKISLLKVIETIQGPIRLNRCLLGVDVCPRQRNCPVTAKLAKLQKYISDYLRGITLDELLRSRGVKKKGKAKNVKRKRI